MTSADPPTCVSESTVITAAIKQVINISCDVDSNPKVSSLCDDPYLIKYS